MKAINSIYYQVSRINILIFTWAGLCWMHMMIFFWLHAAQTEGRFSFDERQREVLAHSETGPQMNILKDMSGRKE